MIVKETAFEEAGPVISSGSGQGDGSGARAGTKTEGRTVSDDATGENSSAEGDGSPHGRVGVDHTTPLGADGAQLGEERGLVDEAENGDEHLVRERRWAWVVRGAWSSNMVAGLGDGRAVTGALGRGWKRKWGRMGKTEWGFGGKRRVVRRGGVGGEERSAGHVEDGCGLRGSTAATRRKGAGLTLVVVDIIYEK